MPIPLQSQMNTYFDQTIICLNFEAATISDEESYALCEYLMCLHINGTHYLHPQLKFSNTVLRTWRCNQNCDGMNYSISIWGCQKILCLRAETLSAMQWVRNTPRSVLYTTLIFLAKPWHQYNAGTTEHTTYQLIPGMQYCKMMYDWAILPTPNPQPLTWWVSPW